MRSPSSAVDPTSTQSALAGSDSRQARTFSSKLPPSGGCSGQLLRRALLRPFRRLSEPRWTRHRGAVLVDVLYRRSRLLRLFARRTAQGLGQPGRTDAAPSHRRRPRNTARTRLEPHVCRKPRASRSNSGISRTSVTPTPCASDLESTSDASAASSTRHFSMRAAEHALSRTRTAGLTGVRAPTTLEGGP